MKLAFRVLNLENSKSALLRPVDAGVATPASQMRVWRTLHIEVTSGNFFRTRACVLDLCLASHISDASLETRPCLDPCSLHRLTPHLEFTISVSRLRLRFYVPVFAEF